MKSPSEILADLAAPFPAEQISWRVGPTTQDKKKGQALCYLDARDVMARLDRVMGAHWQCEYIPMPNGTCCCRIGLKIDGEWVWRANGAVNLTDSDKADAKEMSEKGSYSDAFKRAAVLWGVGQYLYDIDCPWVALDERRRIVSSELPRLRALLDKSGTPLRTMLNSLRDDQTREPEQPANRQEPSRAVTETSAPAATNDAERKAAMKDVANPAASGTYHDPKADALKKKEQAATKSADLQKSRHEEAKRLLKTFNARLDQFRTDLDAREKPAFQIESEFNNWMLTVKASKPNMLTADLNLLRADCELVKGDIKHAVTMETAKNAEAA